VSEPRTEAELAAERSVLGAVLAAGSLDVDAGHRALERIIATGLDPDDFYLASLGNLYAALVELHHRGHPLDPVSVSYELERDGAGSEVLGRLQVLAHEVHAITPAARWAAIVAKAGRERRVA
jgi:replicative DNA helicase